MILAHSIQLDPTVKQLQYFSRAAGTSRFVYNWALSEWNAQYDSGEKPTANELRRYFNSIKYEQFPWLKDVHRDAHSRPFSSLSKAFSSFLRGETKRPAFKKKGKCRDSFYVANDKLSIDGFALHLPVIGPVRITETLRFSGKILSATVSREADRWFIAVNVELPDTDTPALSPHSVGVDLGLTSFAVLSTGERVIAPRPLRQAQRRLRRLNRRLARTQRASSNHRKAVMRLARQHRQVKNIRQDFLHKFTTRLAKAHSEICIEDLNVVGMVKNHNLSLHVRDVAWGETRRQLEYKTVLYGSKVTVRDRFFASTHLCSTCGAKAAKMSLSVRRWECLNCGAIHDRDGNASQNLLQNTAGYAGIYASGESGAVRPLAERGTLPCAISAQER